MKNLKGNTKRQAVPTLKGYAYQIWQSVLQWLELEENQCLFLEGAEDIDFRESNRAVTVQVKATAAPVTLGLKTISDAISNFWEHQTKNPTLQIKFRYLTTSERGFERGDPFNGIRGLDFWDSCKFPGADTYLLRAFLKKSDNLLPDLKTFINNSTEEDLRQKLIIPIEWDTGNKSLEFIEEMVENKVIGYGDKVYDLPPHSSKLVIPHLLKYAWEIVCKDKDRWLRRQDFLEIFEKSTMELVSKRDFREFRRSANQASNPNSLLNFNTQSSASSHQLEATAILENFNLPNLEHFGERVEVTIKVKEILNNAGIIALVGSTGMGKSILSYQLAAATEGNWKKIDLRGCSAEQIKDRLTLAANFIENNSERIDCVLDDLNFGSQISVYENALAKLIFLLKIRNGRIVITSHHKLPIRIESLFDIKKDSSFSVPHFNETEIKNLLTKYGCPDGHKSKYWSKLIFLKTKGHPLLCHAQVRKNAERQFMNWLQYIEEGINSNIISLSACLKNSKEVFEKRIISAVLLSSIKILDVDTRFYANVLLLTLNFIQGWEEEIEDYIEELVVEGWTNIVKLQRFYLHSPQIYADRILSACNTGNLKGISKAATVLLEANNTVSIKLDSETFKYLENLAAK